MKLIYKQITTTNEFLGLREQWNRLVRSTAIDHAFMRHQWFESWIKHLEPDCKLAILTAWSNDQLMAIAPLHIVNLKRKGIMLKILAFMRSGVTPRCNFIIDKSIDADKFFEAVLSTKGWDVSELKSIEKDIPITNQFIDYLKREKNFVIEDGIQSPYEIFDTDWETYLKNQSKSYKKNLRNLSNRLKKGGSFEIKCINTYKAFESVYDSLITISSMSWKAKGNTDFRSMPQMAEFFKEFCKLGNDDKMFVMDILIINEKAVAFSYYLRNKNRLVALRWEYDEEYSYYMPGVALHNFRLKTIFDTGEKWEYDLTGDATVHKEKLLNNIRKHLDITIGSPGLKGNLIMLAKKKIMPSGKSMNETNS